MDEKSALIEKILATKPGDEVPENPEDVLNNMSPEQLAMLTNLCQTDPKIKEELKKSTKAFMPEAGFCLKTKTVKGEKVFLNVCKSPEIGAPRDISEEELIKLIEQDDLADAAFQFRVPMSLGEPHTELDNSAEACTAYDICVSPDFMQKLYEKPTFLGFFVSIVVEGLEQKYEIKLDRNCKMLKNKKFLGKMSEQFIRVKSKPLISEIDGRNNASNQQQDSNENEELKSKCPKYRIVREPAEGVAEFLVAEIELPKLISAKSLTLDIGEDRILLTTRSGIYHLDIYLPYSLDQEECGSQFDKKSKVLTITMPVNPSV